MSEFPTGHKANFWYANTMRKLCEYYAKRQANELCGRAPGYPPAPKGRSATDADHPAIDEKQQFLFDEKPSEQKKTWKLEKNNTTKSIRKKLDHAPLQFKIQKPCAAAGFFFISMRRRSLVGSGLQ